jgi:hypothetical protein
VEEIAREQTTPQRVAVAIRHAEELDRLRAELADHRTMHGDTVGQLQHKLSAAEGLLHEVATRLSHSSELSVMRDSIDSFFGDKYHQQPGANS